MRVKVAMEATTIDEQLRGSYLRRYCSWLTEPFPLLFSPDFTTKRNEIP